MTDEERYTAKKVFVEKLAITPNVTKCAKAAGVSRRIVYEWREVDLDFAAAWEDAEEQGVDEIEGVLKHCANMAPDDARYQTSMLFLLKCRRGGRFIDNYVHTHKGSLNVTHKLDDKKLDTLCDTVIGSVSEVAASERSVPAAGDQKP